MHPQVQPKKLLVPNQLVPIDTVSGSRDQVPAGRRVEDQIMVVIVVLIPVLVGSDGTCDRREGPVAAGWSGSSRSKLERTM